MLDHILVAGLLLALPLRLLMATGVKGDQLPKYFSHEAKLVLYYGNGLLLWLLAGSVAFSWWWFDRSWAELGFQWGVLPYSGAAQSILLLFGALYLLDLFLEVEKDLHSRRSKRLPEVLFRDEGRGREIGIEPAPEDNYRLTTFNDPTAGLGEGSGTATGKSNPELPAFLPATSKEYIHFSLLSLTAGITEEIVYRGYCICYLAWLIGSDEWWQLSLVLLIPALSFGAGHFYQGWRAVLKIVFMAVLFGAFYWYTKSLLVLMIVHTTIDLLGGMLGWTQLRAERSRG